MQPGDLVAFWAIWYGTIRGLLETFREGWNWTWAASPPRRLWALASIVFGVAWLAWNHRPGHQRYEYLEPLDPARAFEPLPEAPEPLPEALEPTTDPPPSPRPSPTQPPSPYRPARPSP